MIVVIVVSLVIALIPLTADFRNKAIRIFGIIWIFVALSCINPLVEECFQLSGKEYSHPGYWLYNLQLIGIFCSAISNNFTPYFYLLFGLYYSNHPEEKNDSIRKRTIAFLCLILPVSSFAVFLLGSLANFPDNSIFLILSIWAVPYIIIGSILLICTYQKSTGKREKKQALLICCLSIPTGLVGMSTSYILRAFGIDNAWLFNRWLALAVVMFYLYLISRYGLLGIKLRIEKMRLDNTMKAVISGTSILNHTIKNEVIKILISANNIKNTKDRYSSHSEDDLQVILNSVRHLESMAKKIQENMKDIELRQNTYNLADIIENAIILAIPYLRQKKIHIIKSYSSPITLKCDEFHLKEVLNNLLLNAIEAIESEGKIEIKIEKTKKNTLLSIKDNGVGIPQETLPYIMDPFFSTKNKHSNYGLGLSYCYNVIQKHSGTIEIDSEPSVGTTVLLKFP